MTAVIDVAALATAVVDQLRAGNTDSSRLDVFDGEPTAAMDKDGRAHPYAAVYAGAGNLSGDALAGAQTELDWPFQVTCAGGDPDRARRAITRVRARLVGHELTVDGLTVGRIVEDPSVQPGPLRIDREVAPPRWYTPMMFRLQATNA